MKVIMRPSDESAGETAESAKFRKLNPGGARWSTSAAPKKESKT
jgi:hypothetical protein